MTTKNLDFLLISLNTIYTNISKTLVLEQDSKFFQKPLKFCSNYYLKVSHDSKTFKIYVLTTLYIVKNIINVICKTAIQNTSITILLRISVFFISNQLTKNYLKKYKNTFRRLFIRNYTGLSLYDNDSYINKVAIINLYIILLCTQKQGTFTLWLYLTHKKIRKLTPM